MSVIEERVDFVIQVRLTLYLLDITTVLSDLIMCTDGESCCERAVGGG